VARTPDQRRVHAETSWPPADAPGDQGKWRTSPNVAAMAGADGASMATTITGARARGRARIAPTMTGPASPRRGTDASRTVRRDVPKPEVRATVSPPRAPPLRT